MIFLKDRFDIYIKEYSNYFLKEYSKKEVKKTRRKLSNNDGYITIDSFITIIRHEYDGIIKEKADYENEVIKLKDQINTYSGIDKYVSGGLLFFGGFLLSKLSDVLKPVSKINDTIYFCVLITLAFAFTFYVIFASVYTKQSEYFYQLCQGILEQMKSKFESSQ